MLTIFGSWNLPIFGFTRLAALPITSMVLYVHADLVVYYTKPRNMVVVWLIHKLPTRQCETKRNHNCKTINQLIKQ